MIKKKQKKCKGTSKAINYIGCNDLAYKRTYGLCDKCLRKWYLETEEGKEQLQKITLKVTAPRKSLEKAIENHKQTNGIQAALKVTKVVVHNMIRLRDEGLNCISCDAQWNNTFHAGHLYASGNFFSIRFDFDNIFGQCTYCNLMKDGNENEYHLRLPNRIGVVRYQNLVNRAENDKRIEKKWTKDELKEIRKESNRIIKEIKNK